jgi:hypothetical protein
MSRWSGLGGTLNSVSSSNSNTAPVSTNSDNCNKSEKPTVSAQTSGGGKIASMSGGGGHSPVALAGGGTRRASPVLYARGGGLG